MLRTIFAVLTPAMLFAGCASAAQPTSAPRPLTSTAPLAQCFDEQAAIMPFSGVALAARGDDILVRTSGHADLAGQVPITRETRFRIGSINKVMTRAAIGRLVDQGRLLLEDEIGRHVPGLPPELASITVEQLLRHRSGLGSYMRPGAREIVERARTANDLLPLIIQERPAFPAGTQERYSNSGYVLLGVIIENITGRSYGDYLRSEMFEPLGMGATTLAAHEAMAQPLTRLTGPGRPPAEEPRVAQRAVREHGTPAGNAVTTVDDLLQFGRALIEDKFISAETKARIFPRTGDFYRIGQAGGTSGVNADFAVMPESGWIIAVLTNRDPPAGEIMGEVLRTAAVGRGCTVLTEAERPSPFSRPRVAPSEQPQEPVL